MTRNSVTELLDATRLEGLSTTRGGRVVARVSLPDAKGSTYRSRLVEIDGERLIPLTRGAVSVGSVALAEDGSTYFTAKRVGEDGQEADDATLWGLPARGEAAQLAQRPGGFGRVVVAGSVLIAEIGAHSQATDEESHARLTKQRTDAKVSGVLHAGFPIRYWASDIGPEQAVLAVATLPADLTALVPASGSGAPSAEDAEKPGTPPQALAFRWAKMPAERLIGWEAAPDGSFAIATTETSRPDLIDAIRVWRIDLAGDRAPEMLADSVLPHDTYSGRISPDGTRVLIGNERRWLEETSLRSETEVLDLATGERTRLWPEHDFWLDPEWLDDSTVVASSDDHGRGSVWVGAIGEASPRRVAGGPEQDLTFGTPAVAAGRIITSASGIMVAPFPVSIDPATDAVSELPNPATRPTQIGRLREVTTTASDGTPLRAWLRLPEGDGPHPLAVFAHGGPWGSWNAWTYRWNPTPFVDAGYAVLLPDPAISTGYGQGMIDRGQFELGGAPFTDIMTLIDATIETGDVDPDRTAFTGGSYGGYMANWVAGHTGDRFRCIVTHASLWDVDSMGRTTDNAGWEPSMRAQYEQYSPHHSVGEIEVPMLVIHGDKDYRVPIGQGQQLWYDLLSFSKTPLSDDGTTQHRFLYFPDEAHWILGRGNAQAWYDTFIDFLDLHVLGERRERAATLG